MDEWTPFFRLLRPAGGGIYTVSTGTVEQRAIQRRVYGAQRDEDIQERWQASIRRLPEARVVLLGVPCDVGAGFMRGASFGPGSIRRELIRAESWVLEHPAVVDLGDVLVCPQLLHDEMLSEAQMLRTRRAIHGDDAVGQQWPVSPLSVTEFVLRRVRDLAPEAIPMVIGGDHSVGWPVLAAVAAGRERKTGILHFDAHTDLLESRLGVKYCFATWAWHANELIGRGRRLQQVGIRASGKDRAYWEQTCDVRQYWMPEMKTRPLDDIAQEMRAAFWAAGVEGVYISNDIDGTDPRYARATGTPADNGLTKDMVKGLIRRVAAQFPVWGGDLVEVAPTLANYLPHEPMTTLATARTYLEAQIEVALEGVSTASAGDT